MSTIAQPTLPSIGPTNANAANAQLPPGMAEGAARMAPLVDIWVRQIDAACAHGMDSVDALTQLFAGIDRQLADAIELTQQAAQAMQGTGDGGMSGAVEAAGARLQHVTAMIESAVSSHHALFEQVAQAVHAMSDLNEAAQSVERISQMTTLLSINARAEAARAGEAGQGFAVVADEACDLAAQSRQASQTMTARVARMASVIRGTADAADALKQRDLELMDRSRHDMGVILDELGDAMCRVVETSGSLCTIGQGTRMSVAQALVQFQFQDRITQRLTHVQSSARSFGQALAQGWPDAEQVGALSEGLLTSYTMPEEGRIHRNEPEPADDSDGLVLF